jgi:hypothetical protein
MRKLVYGLVLLLVILHQDFWNWHRHEPLILGFIPIGLAHHVGISIAAALVAGLAVRFCWPEDLEDVGAGSDTAPPEGRRRQRSAARGEPE